MGYYMLLAVVGCIIQRFGKWIKSQDEISGGFLWVIICY